MKFKILTLFPEMIDGYIQSSIVKRAIDKKIIEVSTINFRSYAGNKHATVDDYAYGGGAGMLIKVDPIHRALQSIPCELNQKIVLTSPTGQLWSQQLASDYAKLDQLIIICGHYEGIDERILNYVDDVISIGDYILTGGEIPALSILDSVSRLVPNVISEESVNMESFMNGLLEYPQYTRPPIYENFKVPEVLLSGHHANIKKWQRYQSLKKTYLNRSDLLANAQLTREDLEMLEEIKNEKN